ncbi:MAG: PEP-CTERM sorting domain-containing protein [Kiritimatiellales bacterium]
MNKKLQYLISMLVGITAIASAGIITNNVYFSDFTDAGKTDLADYGWETLNGNHQATGNSMAVNDGIVSIGNRKAGYDFGQSYALSSTILGADVYVDEMWMRLRIKSGGDNDGTNVRIGLGTLPLVQEQSGRFGSVAIQSHNNNEASANRFAACAQNVQSAWNNTLDNSNFVEFFVRYIDVSGQIKVDVWYNPADADNLGAPDSSTTQDYSATYGAGLISQLEINSWGTSTPHLLDAVEVWTVVIPEPSTMGLFGIIGAGLLICRRKIR